MDLDVVCNRRGLGSFLKRRIFQKLSSVWLCIILVVGREMNPYIFNQRMYFIAMNQCWLRLTNAISCLISLRISTRTEAGAGAGAGGYFLKIVEKGDQIPSLDV